MVDAEDMISQKEIDELEASLATDTTLTEDEKAAIRQTIATAKDLGA